MNLKINMKFDRPIVFFDCETTGLNVAKDRIVSISVLKINPDSSTEGKSSIINPEMPIPKESSDVHGITDDLVIGKPTFKQLSKSLHAFMKDCDIAGYNNNQFDNIILCEEFSRVGFDFPEGIVRIIDVCTIFKKLEQRTLSAAYKFYCNKELEDAHSSTADTMATAEVFIQQLNKYDEIRGKSIDEVSDFCKVDNRVDLAGRIILNEQGEYLFNFGKNKNQKVVDNKSYAEWMLSSDFSGNTKSVLKKILSENKDKNEPF